MPFVPIQLEDYICLHLKSNPSDRAADVRLCLRKSLKAFQDGELCDCGEPIWVIGSAFAGRMCFTCITGSADNSQDYEIAEACRY